MLGEVRWGKTEKNGVAMGLGWINSGKVVGSVAAMAAESRGDYVA